MKIKYYKLRRWLLISVMGMLGLSACHTSKKAIKESDQPREPLPNPREEIRLMYGVPTMDFSIRGRVTDSNGKPIEGVQVNLLEYGVEIDADTIVGNPASVQKYLSETAVFTDKKGHFVLSDNGLPAEQRFIFVSDSKDKTSAKYKSKVVNIDITNSDVDKGKADGWYQGAVKKIIEIHLESK